MSSASLLGVEIPKFVDKTTTEYKPKFDALLVEPKEAGQKSLKESERLEKEIAEVQELKTEFGLLTSEDGGHRLADRTLNESVMVGEAGRHYQRFVQNYGLIARPLVTLTKKDGFVWLDSALSAFSDLKEALRIDIRTNHYTLKFLMEQRITTTERLLKLMPYDFSLGHKVGKENRGAYALSRRSIRDELLTHAIPCCVELCDIREGLRSDPYTSILQKVKSIPVSLPHFSVVDDLIFYKKRLNVPDIPSLKQKLLLEAHNSPIDGHGGFLKTFK
ncbi:hypothetical protein E3N88_45286 [Mikania micrantha]|uniref:Integrase zinc-binding domain-containing protein n=1 Tax=Mikania micrantha TaxID=192012 RepID=A0A5N6LC00_9ASTR|nr:hypothetical protein E3N88_45286 [Mikania micrantha]